MPVLRTLLRCLLTFFYYIGKDKNTVTEIISLGSNQDDWKCVIYPSKITDLFFSSFGKNV